MRKRVRTRKRKRVRTRKRKRKRMRKRMIFTLVIELVAVFLQLVALLLGSLQSTSLAACFPSPLCLFHSPSLGAYFIFLPFGACFSLFCKHITSLSIISNFWFVWICDLWYIEALFGTCGLWIENPWFELLHWMWSSTFVWLEIVENALNEIIFEAVGCWLSVNIL